MLTVVSGGSLFKGLVEETGVMELYVSKKLELWSYDMCILILQ